MLGIISYFNYNCVYVCMCVYIETIYVHSYTVSCIHMICVYHVYDFWCCLQSL